MSSHRLPAWEPDRNYVYNDLNKPKEGLFERKPEFKDFLKSKKSQKYIEEDFWSIMERHIRYEIITGRGGHRQEVMI